MCFGFFFFVCFGGFLSEEMIEKLILPSPRIQIAVCLYSFAKCSVSVLLNARVLCYVVYLNYSLEKI